MRPAFAPDRISQRGAEMQLSLLLHGATDERLRGFTVSQLAGMYRVKEARIEVMLRQARQDRHHD